MSSDSVDSLEWCATNGIPNAALVWKFPIRQTVKVVIFFIVIGDTKILATLQCAEHSVHRRHFRTIAYFLVQSNRDHILRIDENSRSKIDQVVTNQMSHQCFGPEVEWFWRGVAITLSVVFPHDGHEEYQQAD